jgi:hypothetical protein
VKHAGAMLDALLADLQASPLTAIFVLTLVTTLLLQRLWRYHLKLSAKQRDD